MRKQGNVDENCDIKLINQINGVLLRPLPLLHLSQTFIAVIKMANEKMYLRTYPAAIMFYRNKELLHEEAIISGCLFEEMGCPIYFAMTLTRSMIISPLPTPMTSLSVPSMSFLKESRHQVFAACSYQGPVFPSRVLMGRGAVIDSGTKCIRACQELLQPLLIMPFCNLVLKKLEKYVG